MGLTQIMAEELPSLTMDEIQNMAVLMRKSSANLFRLLSNLLEWSSMQRGLTVFKPSAFQLEQKISESLAVVLEVAKRKYITLKYDITPGLMVFGDGNMIEGILRNLVTNATKFTPAGGDVLVSARLNPENLIEISIKDSGIGMNQHMMDHLFNIDENTSREGTEGEPSTGLGLIICKDFVEKHGGRLWVESQVGKGSTFHFTISQSNSPDDVRMKNESATGVKTTGHGGKLKILIAEDDESSEMLIRMILKAFSNDIICVRTGLDAVDACRTIHDIDLVMMDIKMPVMDGFEATRQIRKFNNDVVIIVQTAFESADTKERAFEVGCNDFIPKPLDAALLKSVIQRHFNLK
jgi:CheY-like chemotaxis protein